MLVTMSRNTYACLLLLPLTYALFTPLRSLGAEDTRKATIVDSSGQETQVKSIGVIG